MPPVLLLFAFGAIFAQENETEIKNEHEVVVALNSTVHTAECSGTRFVSLHNEIICWRYSEDELKNDCEFWRESFYALIVTVIVGPTSYTRDANCTEFFDFLCANKKECITQFSRCDYFNTCDDGSDEWNCGENFSFCTLQFPPQILC